MFDIGKMLAGYGKKAGTWIDENPDLASIALGKAAQSMVAGKPGGAGAPIDAFGNLGVFLGQSGLAAKEKESQEEKQRMFQQMLMDMVMGKQQVPLTPELEDGPTTSGVKFFPDGQFKFSMDGRVPKQTPSSEPGDPPLRQPVQSPAPTRAPEAFRSSLLPFLSALQGNDKSGVNLKGLPPELIAEFASQGQRGQQLKNQTMDTIYSNIVKQAQADYYGRLPQAPKPTFRDWKWSGDIDSKGRYILYNEDGETRIGPEAHKSAMEGKGSGTVGFKEIPFQNRDGSFSTLWVQTGSRPGAGTVYPGAGEPIVSQEKEKRAVSIDPKVAEAESNILTYSSKPEMAGDVEYYHQHAPDSYTGYFVWKPGMLWGGDWIKEELPKGATMGDVRKEAKDLGVPISTYLKKLYEKYGKK